MGTAHKHWFKISKLNFVGKKGFHITCQNVRGLYSRGKFDMLRQQIMDSETHVFCVSETLLNNEFSDSLIYIPGYSLYRLDRSWGEGKDRVKK